VFENRVLRRIVGVKGDEDEPRKSDLKGQLEGLSYTFPTESIVII
jgi:hypothetical protein